MKYLDGISIEDLVREFGRPCGWTRAGGCRAPDRGRPRRGGRHQRVVNGELDNKYTPSRSPITVR